MIKFDLPQFLRLSTEIWKLLMLMSFVIFSAFILIWYHERPYGIFLSSNLGKNGFKSETDRVSTSPVELVGANGSSTASVGSPPSNETIFSNFFNSLSKTKLKGKPDVVVSISGMNDMLHQSRFSYEYEKPQWPSRVDEELLNARKLIEDAPQIKEKKPSVYRNYSKFLRSYELMKSTLKIYIYAEGDGPVFQETELDGIYSSEGWFKKQLKENKQLVTKTADRAHLFYLPFSSHLLKNTFQIPKTNFKDNMTEYLSSYLRNITTNHRFWNRTGGAGHFLVACHDWAPGYTSRLMKNCIRALCNAEIKGGGKFEFGKDISLPEIYIHNAKKPLKDLGGKPPSQRSTLAFFAGGVHGYLRPMFLKYWEDKDPDMKIFGKLRVLKSHKAYVQFMKGSKYCLSVRGFEPYTPRVVEAIFYECVPVIIADNYVPPFFETLDWESFAVFVGEKDVPNLKNILLSISEEKYVEMQERVKQVQKHFLWNTEPVDHDVFHMILHAIWYNRVFQMR